MKKASMKYGALILMPPLVFLILFYFYPLGRIFTMSLMPEGGLDLSRITKLLADGFYLKTLWFTTWQAAVSTLLTLALALPGAYFFANFRFFGKGLLSSFATVPFVLPTVVTATAFRALLGPHGLVNAFLMEHLDLAAPPVNIDHTIWYILLAHVFYNYTVVLKIVGGYWAHIQPGLRESAQMLGASPLRAFREITLPLLMPSILAAALLVFIFCFSSFGVILILGGPRFSTIEVEIYRHAVHLFNLPMAAALSIVQILFTFLLMWVYTSLARKTAVVLTPEARSITQRKPHLRREKIGVALNALLMTGFLGAPLIALLVGSVSTEQGFSLDYYRALFENREMSIFFVPPSEAILNSLGFAGTTLVLALVLGLFAATFLARERGPVGAFLDPVFMLPLSTSAVTLGFGFIIALDAPPLNLRSSILLVPLAHTLVAFPFVVRSILPAMRSIPASLREVAQVLGASPFTVWRRVDLPIVGRAVMVGAVFAFTVSMGEFGATVFTARPQTPTMPLAVYRFLGQPGAMNLGQAMAMSSLLMLVTAASFMFLEKARIGEMGEF